MFTLAILLATRPFSHVAPRPDLLIAGSGPNIPELARHFGDVRKTREGFLSLTLRKNVTASVAAHALTAGGARYVLNATAANVETDSWKSIRDHLQYLTAKKSLGPHKAGTAESDEELGAGDLESQQWFISLRSGKSGKIDRNMFQEGVAHRQAMPAAKWPGAERKVGGAFTSIGPRSVSTPYSIYMSAGPVSGRKNGIAYAPSNANIIYVATAGGGVWKSVNGGSSFFPLSDNWPFLNTNSVAVHPTNPNIVLVGTGDYYGNFSANAFGIMRSVDGGVTWTNVGDSGMRAGCISRIIIEPTNPNIVTVSVGKDGNHTSQIHRSTDGGITWAPVNILENGVVVGGDFDGLSRAVNGYYYAAATYPGTSGALIRSTDHGASWTFLTSPASNTVEEKAIDITCSKVNAAVVYVLLTAEQKVYRSNDYGASWTEITGNFPQGTPDNPNYNWSQGYYDYHISCAKDGSVDLLFVGLITVAMSRGGGNNWVDIGHTFSPTPPNYIHADQHSFAMNPANPNQVLFGCDGGLFRFTHTAGTLSGTWQTLNPPFTDFLVGQMAVSPTSDAYLQCGCQDNFSPSARGTTTSWTGLPAGDGCWTGYLPSGQNFVSNQHGGIFLYPSLTSTTPANIRSTSNAFETGFFAPYIYAGSTPAIYGGAKYLWRYTGTGSNWTNLGTQIAPYTAQPGELLDEVTELEGAKNNKSIIYSGSIYGEVFMATNNGTVYRQIDDAHIDRVVGAINTAWANPYDVIVGLMGDRNGNPRLWRCTNTQATTPVWNSVSGIGINALPDVPVNSVERDPYDVNTWYVATDVGCFMTTNAGSSWANMNSLGLPNVLSTVVTVNASKTALFVGTFGRGIWKAPLAVPATKFSIAGHVGSVSIANVPGVSMYLYKWKSTPVTVNTAPHIPIPDYDPNGVFIPITIGSTGKVTNVSTYVSITHQIPNDLQIWLVAPNNSATKLWSSDVPVQPNLAKTFTTTFFNGVPSGGTWRLWVADGGPLVTGTVDIFDLTVQTDGYVLIGSAATTASGTYGIANLDTGLYDVVPKQTGHTFTPSGIIMNLGPSRTAVNFVRN